VASFLIIIIIIIIIMFILGEFAKLRKGTINFVMSVRMEHLDCR